MEFIAALQNFVSGSAPLYGDRPETSLHSVRQPASTLYDSERGRQREPVYDIYLVTTSPIGVVRREADYDSNCGWRSRNIRYVTPDGKKHTKLKAAANHLLEAYNDRLH